MDRAAVVAYLKAQGLPAFPANVTVAKQARHPDVKGNGFVPYGIVFDHTGKLVYHHMTGSYHGGDGWRMVELAEELVEKAPVIYLGKEPFRKIDALAQKVATGKGLAGLIKTIETHAVADGDDATKAELERLLGRIKAHQSRGIERAVAAQATEPSRVASMLKDLAKEFKGTSLAGEVDAKLAEMNASADLKTAIGIEKGFAKAVRGWEKLKAKKRTAKAKARLVKKLEKLIADHKDLPIAGTVAAYLAGLR